jgi:hypothetical protein
MVPLSKEWLKVVGEAVGKTPDEVLKMIGEWWYQGHTLPVINAKLKRLAEDNGKKLILVDQTNN